MTRSPLHRAMLTLAIAVGAVPPLFGVVRAATTRLDLRAFWMALASAVAAWFAVMIAGAAGRPLRPFSTAIGVALIATLVASTVGAMLGALNVIAVVMVGLGFGLCYGASYLLLARSRPR